MYLIKWKNRVHKVSIIISFSVSVVCFLVSVFSATLLLSLIRGLFIFILTGNLIWFLLNMLEKYNIKLDDFMKNPKEAIKKTKKNILNNRKKSKILNKTETKLKDDDMEQKAKNIIESLGGDMKSKVEKIANIISLKLKGED